MHIKKTINVKTIGQFTPIVRNRKGEVIREYSTTRNVITDHGHKWLYARSGANNIGQVNGYINALRYLDVGTGVTELTHASTDLGNPLNEYLDGSGAASFSGNTIGWELIEGIYYLKCTTRYVYPVGQIIGTISELGMFNVNSGGNLVAGQLIKDGAGNPTTITLTADEQLEVKYDLFHRYYDEVIDGGERGLTIYDGPVTTSTGQTVNCTVNQLVQGMNNVTAPGVGNPTYLTWRSPIGGSWTSGYPTLFKVNGSYLANGPGLAEFVSTRSSFDNKLQIFMEASIFGAAGQFNISDLWFGGTSTGQYPNIIRIHFDTPIPKSELEMFKINIELELKWREDV